MEAIAIDGITYQWKLSLKSFNRAEEVYGWKPTADALAYVTPGILPRFIWCGLMEHESKTGERAPTFDKVLDWASERQGVFQEFSSPCVQAINQLWSLPIEERTNGEAGASVSDAPFSTGEKSSASAS